MKNILFVILIMICEVALSQNTRHNCYITVEDMEGVERLHISGTLCDDSIFYFDKVSQEVINKTNGLVGGHVILHNEGGGILGQLSIIDIYEEDLDMLLGPNIFCIPDKPLLDKNDFFFIFPKCKTDKDRAMATP